jgi:hypothetical protein
MRKLLLAVCLLWATTAHGWLAVFDFGGEVPEVRPPSVVLSLIETPAAHFKCLPHLDGLSQVVIVATMTYIPACAVWYVEPQPYHCTIYITPNRPDYILGHEIRHCFDLDFHNALGL